VEEEDDVGCCLRGEAGVRCISAAAAAVGEAAARGDAAAARGEAASAASRGWWGTGREWRRTKAQVMSLSAVLQNRVCNSVTKKQFAIMLQKYSE